MGSLRTRLALGFFAVALAAVALAGAAIVPGLEERLREAKLRDTAAIAAQYAPELQKVVGTNVNARRVLERVRQIADQTSTRVTVLLVNTRNGQVDVSPTYDSFETNELDLEFGVALQTARSGRPQTGTETGASGGVGQVARPLFQRDPEGRRLLGYVAVFSTQLRDVESSVNVVERRVLIAGGAAASIALLAGTAAVYAQLGHMRRMDIGMSLDQVLVVKGPRIMPDGADGASLLSTFRNELREVPGIGRVAFSGSVPGSWFECL